jgi:hypothetical protein
VGQTLWEENFNSFDTAIWNVDLGDDVLIYADGEMTNYKPTKTKMLA